MASLRFNILMAVLLLVVHVRGGPVPEEPTGTESSASKDLNEVDTESAADDQLTSGSVATNKVVVPDSKTSESSPKGDLKSSDSFGLGYYLPIVGPALVKYHYPLLYYPTAYLHSIRHHGYGGYGFHQYGHGVIH